MSNPTNRDCPNNIARLRTTDYRPNKALYENVFDNNKFRLYLQRNANKLRQQETAKFHGKMACCNCEKQPRHIIPYDRTESCKYKQMKK
jgi:flagellar basal body rod protein FlgB